VYRRSDWRPVVQEFRGTIGDIDAAMRAAKVGTGLGSRITAPTKDAAPRGIVDKISTVQELKSETDRRCGVPLGRSLGPRRYERVWAALGEDGEVSHRRRQY